MIKKQNILNIIGLCNIRQSIKFHKRHLSSLKYYKDIPGPKSYPIIGSLLETKSCGNAEISHDIKTNDLSLIVIMHVFIRW